MIARFRFCKVICDQVMTLACRQFPDRNGSANLLVMKNVDAAVILPTPNQSNAIKVVTLVDNIHDSCGSSNASTIDAHVEFHKL